MALAAVVVDEAACLGRGPAVLHERGGNQLKRDARLCSNGGPASPRPGVKTATRACGVTSTAGFLPATPSGAVRRAPKLVTSSPSRSSITIPSPARVARSRVDDGHAT